MAMTKIPFTVYSVALLYYVEDVPWVACRAMLVSGVNPLTGDEVRVRAWAEWRNDNPGVAARLSAASVSVTTVEA